MFATLQYFTVMSPLPLSKNCSFLQFEYCAWPYCSCNYILIICAVLIFGIFYEVEIIEVKEQKYHLCKIFFEVCNIDLGHSFNPKVEYCFVCKNPLKSFVFWLNLDMPVTDHSLLQSLQVLSGLFPSVLLHPAECKIDVTLCKWHNGKGLQWMTRRDIT